MTTIETLHTWDTVYSADSVEWCPNEPHRTTFVCGTYQLSQETSAQDEPAKRLGRLLLFTLSPSDGLLLKQSLEMPAVLDLKWCHMKLEGRTLLAVANADGDVLIYELLDDGLSPNAKCNIGQKSSGTLALSIDWSTGRNLGEPLITVSDSKGFVSLLKFISTELEIVRTWKAHGFEAWITAFDYWNPSIIYSGGDDCKWKAFDARVNADQAVHTSTVHEAGVTSLHSNSGREHLIASGSYDENLRLWDSRSLRQPLSKTCLDGGVWRLKWDSRNHVNLLAACMHDGFKVIACDDCSSPLVTASYNNHESLAYGSDWCSLNTDEVSQLLPVHGADHKHLSVIGTCSFYDHRLCVSLVKYK